MMVFAGFELFAQQPVVSPNPTTINDVVTITYGPDASNNWTYLDPQSENPLYLYLGLDTDNNPSTWEYSDKWNNCDASNLIPMYYNSTTGKYEASFDMRTHNFAGNGGILSTGTTVYHGQFIIRKKLTFECAANPSNQASWQGANQYFPITAAQVIMATCDIERTFLDQTAIVDGKIHFSKAGSYTVKILDANGRIIKTMDAKNVQNKDCLPLEINNSDFKICIIEDKNGNKKVIKFTK